MVPVASATVLLVALLAAVEEEVLACALMLAVALVAFSLGQRGSGAGAADTADLTVVVVVLDTVLLMLLPSAAETVAEVVEEVVFSFSQTGSAVEEREEEPVEGSGMVVV